MDILEEAASDASLRPIEEFDRPLQGERLLYVIVYVSCTYFLFKF